MRAVSVIGMAATAITVFGSLGATPSAHASNFGVELNGTFLVSSNGQWARTNDVLMDEKTVIQTWTVSTTCVSAIECSGEVKSDLGWTAPIRLDNFWYVEHEVENWVPCPDGSFAPGRQQFIMWGVNPETQERVTNDLKFLGGRDVTTSPSGACGRNRPLVIELPMWVQKKS